MRDLGSIPMGEPLAYLLTWTTYGTWLPGDERSWVDEGKGIQQPNSKTRHEAQRKLAESSLLLDDDQRIIVERTIRQHGEIRGWTILAVNCRTNHVHVVVQAPVHPDIVMGQFKSWCTRRLKEHQIGQNPTVTVRERWWTEDGSKRYLNNMASVEGAMQYVLENQ